MIEHHGIAATNALHQGIGKTRRTSEQRRIAHMLTAFMGQLSAATIERRYMGGHMLKALNGTLQLIVIPNVILVGPGIEIGLNIRPTSKRQKIRRKTLGWTALNNTTTFP